MTWLMIITILKKIGTWLKRHFYVPVLLVVMLFMYITHINKVESLKKVIQVNKESYKKEIDVINTSYEKEKEAKEALRKNKDTDIEELQKKLDVIVEKIRGDFKKEEAKLEESKQSYVEELTDDPHNVSDEIDNYVEGELK